MKNLEIIKAALAKYRHVGIRGLGEEHATKKYRKGQYLKKSYNNWDDGNWGYLKGTSAIQITDHMEDSEILEIIKNVSKLYSGDFNKTCVIAGDEIDYGTDHEEVILSNIVGFDRRGAIFVDYLEV